MASAYSRRKFLRPWTVALAALLVAGGVGVAVPSTAWSGAEASAPEKPAWLDSGNAVGKRVDALLQEMTLPEKVGQMDQQLVTTLTDADGGRCGDFGFNMPNTECMQKILIEQQTGSILAGGTNNPPDTTGKGGIGNTGEDWANEYNTIQSFAIQNSRLHIPVIFGVDAVHGFGHPWQAPLFPQSIGMGATWDTGAALTGGAMTAKATKATGWTWVFAPVQDLARAARTGVGAGRGQCQGAANRSGRSALARRGGHGQALRGVLPVDQRARP